MNLRLVEKYYSSNEYLEKLRARAEVLKECADNDFHRARMVLDHWAVDPIEFIETFLFLKLPNYQNAVKPFFLFDYQKRIIRKLMEAEQDVQDHMILIDKPREMGITWTIIAYYYWRWLFTPNWSGFILSRSESEVDDGSISPDNSIFGKIRWLMTKTPKFLFPDSFQPKGRKGTNTDMALKILNPALSTSINGSTTNSNAGRSRRYSITFIDEAFFIENFRQVWRSLESVSRVKVFVSSAKQGRVFEKFKEMCEAKGDYINLTWQDHPWKDEEWFKDLEKKAEFDPEIMREAVVDYALDKKSMYYPQISQAATESLQYDPKRPLYISLDIGRGDLTVIVWWQYVGNGFNIIECYSSSNKDITWYAPFMNPELMFNPEAYPTEYQRKLLEKIRKWRKPTAWFGAHDHFKKSMTDNRSCADVLMRNGVRLRYNTHAITYEPRRKAVAAILPLTTFNSDSDYVMNLFDALADSRYANAVAPTSPQTVMKPVHDAETADYREAFENGAANILPILRLQRNEERSERVGSLTRNLLGYLKN